MISKTIKTTKVDVIYRAKQTKEMRVIANGFRQLIDIKQAKYDKDGTEYTPETLIAGTPYENRVLILDDRIITPLAPYVWLYTARCGSTPAILTEDKGF